jgi:chromosome segregation ATPase
LKNAIQQLESEIEALKTALSAKNAELEQSKEEIFNISQKEKLNAQSLKERENNILELQQNLEARTKELETLEGDSKKTISALETQQEDLTKNLQTFVEEGQTLKKNLG